MFCILVFLEMNVYIIDFSKCIVSLCLRMVNGGGNTQNSAGSCVDANQKSGCVRGLGKFVE